ncbi:hypothetical protein Bca52824_016176 [Brassica carinata]|uniref:Uncharacterized protein n=1 Tax=Brassica carinata TaxID=52824 RepID=A0A8X7W6I6_BRACI|nr:hypothetical protein Bca52824_016176 [Brassica carinata]
MAAYTSLSTLNSGQQNALIKVELLRRWKIKLPSPPSYNLKLILVDSEHLQIIKTNVSRTGTTNNPFKLKFSISTIVKPIPSVSSSLYVYPTRFADIIHKRLDFQIAVGE